MKKIFLYEDSFLLTFLLCSLVALMFSVSVDVFVLRQDCLSLSEVSHNRPSLAAAAWRLTETDATSLRNISGLCQADPASTGPRNSSIRENA